MIPFHHTRVPFAYRCACGRARDMSTIFDLHRVQKGRFLRAARQLFARSLNPRSDDDVRSALFGRNGLERPVGRSGRIAEVRCDCVDILPAGGKRTFRRATAFPNHGWQLGGTKLPSEQDELMSGSLSDQDFEQTRLVAIRVGGAAGRRATRSRAGKACPRIPRAEYGARVPGQADPSP